MNYPFISENLRTAIELEKMRAKFADQSEIFDAHEKHPCDEMINKIGELLTSGELAVARGLRLRSEIRRIHRLGLTSTSEYGSYVNRHKQYRASIDGQDKEYVQDVLICVEPDTFKIITCDEDMEEEKTVADLLILPTKLAQEYHSHEDNQSTSGTPAAIVAY